MAMAAHGVPSIRRLALIATIALVASGVWTPAAQAARGPSPTWHRKIGYDANAVAVARNGDAYVVGATKPASKWKLMLRKFAPDGSLIWARTWLPPKAGHVIGRDVAVASDGGVYVVGSVGTNSCEGSGWFIARYTPAGTLVWLQDEHGWAQCTVADTYASVAVSRGRVMVAGDRFGCCGEAFNEGYLKLYTAGGRLMKVVPFEAPGIDTKYYDGATGVAADVSGAFFATGWTNTGKQATVDDFVNQELVIQSFTADGTLAWSHVPRDHGKRDEDRGTAIAVRDGRVTVTADVGKRTYVRSRAWLGALTLDGVSVWSTRWGANLHGNVSSTGGVSIAPDGTVYVAGTRRDLSDHGNNLVVRKFGRGGSLIWQTELQHGILSLFGNGAGAMTNGAYIVGSNVDGGGHLWRFTH